MGVLPACVSVPGSPQRAEEGGLGFPDTGIRNKCELPCGAGNPNLDPLPEQRVPLPAEPSLKAPCTIFMYSFSLFRVISLLESTR